MGFRALLSSRRNRHSPDRGIDLETGRALSPRAATIRQLSKLKLKSGRYNFTLEVWHPRERVLTRGRLRTSDQVGLGGSPTASDFKLVLQA
jgi:hypothetical protein